MAAKFVKYFKVVSPAPQTTTMTDSQEMTDVGAYNNYTWYQRLIQGSASRMTRYREYDLMDNDIEVCRALDTIAEEITGNDPKTHELLQVDVVNDSEASPESLTVLTLKSALRRWAKMHDLDVRLFKIARMVIKYGDVFFRKNELMDKWEFVHPKNVVAALVDDKDATKVIAWQLKKDLKRPKLNGYSLPLGAKVDTQMDTELVDARDIVRFCMNDDMSDTQPFGESVLRSVYRAHKQKELLEDAIIIYRIQRAPERRVFYIDVGKMPPNRVKTYLEQIKNDIRQKKIPNINGGQSEVDATYNPMQQTEDFFFACLDLHTKIPLLDSRTLTLQEIIDEFKQGKENWAYSIDPDTGNVVPGPISWAGVTRKNTETVVLHLDNGKTITCTPDHKFPVQGKGFVQAKDLTPCDSLWPFSTNESWTNNGHNTRDSYPQIYNPATQKWTFVHQMVAKFMKSKNCHQEFAFDEQFVDAPKRTIHHYDFNGKNNVPSNLFFMNFKDHALWHRQFARNQEAQFPKDMFDRFEQIANEDLNIKFKALMIRLNNDNQFMTIYREANTKQENDGHFKIKYKLKTNEFRQKMFLRFIKCFGYNNWKSYRDSKIQQRVHLDVRPRTNKDVRLLQLLLHYVKTISVHNFTLVNYFRNNKNQWAQFAGVYNEVFSNGHISVPESSMFDRIAKHYNYVSFKDLVNKAANFNHRIVKIEKGPNMDVGTITIDLDEKYHNYHTFALDCGVFTKNSRPDGRGSRVDTLPGGASTGVVDDLEYFQHKVWRGLRVPASYMIEQQEGGQIWNDGKVGVAYIQELRFFIFCSRIQNYIEKTLDSEFKKFLKQAGITIDEEMYQIRMPPPSNFGKYREQQMDSSVLGQFGSADSIPYLSKRFILKRYLYMKDEEIAINERMKREELGLDPEPKQEDMVKIYAPPQEPGMMPSPGLGGMEMPMSPQPGLPGEPPIGSEGSLSGAPGASVGANTNPNMTV